MSDRRRYSDEAIFAEIRALAAALCRTPLAMDWRASGRRPCFATICLRFRSWDAAVAAAGLPAVEPPAPGWQSGSGHRTYWTEDRVIAGLRLFRKVHGSVPDNDDEYNRLKRGDLRFPTAQRVYELGGGSWSRALKLAGVPFNHDGDRWSRADEDLLLELAGKKSLKEIAARLRRSYGSCRRRLYDLGSRARDAQGDLTAQQCAAEYNVPIHRVLDLIRRGTLPARKGPGGAYWQIDADAAAACAELRAPKRTHKGVPPDIGDYRQRYGLRRTKKATFAPTKWTAG